MTNQTVVGVVSIEIITCANCFLEFGQGVYRFMVRPVLANNWIAGIYNGQVQVNASPTVTLYSLYEFGIP